MKKTAYLLGVESKFIPEYTLLTVGRDNQDGYSVEAFNTLREAKNKRDNSGFNSLWQKASIYKLVKI